MNFLLNDFLFGLSVGFLFGYGFAVYMKRQIRKLGRG